MIHLPGADGSGMVRRSPITHLTNLGWSRPGPARDGGAS